MNQETLFALHFGYDKQAFGTMSVPVYQTTAYDFGSAETAANRFALKNSDQSTHVLIIQQPMSLKHALLRENGEAAIATASGQAAIFLRSPTLQKAGDNIIVAKKIYGGATTLLTHTIKRFGIKAKIFNSDSAEDLEDLIDDKTKAIFFETAQTTNCDSKHRKDRLCCKNITSLPLQITPLQRLSSFNHSPMALM